MGTGPRVLDRAGRARTTIVEVVASTLTEFLVGLQTFQFEEAAHTFDVGPDWFDRVRTNLSEPLSASLAKLGPVGWGSILGKALVERWPEDIPASIDRVETLAPRDLWLLLAGYHLPPFADRIEPEVFGRAADGDASARAHLLDVAIAAYGENEEAGGHFTLDAQALHELVVTSLRGWYQDVFAAQEQGVAPILVRDADAKRRLRRTVTDDKLVELATNGLDYVAEPWVRRIILTPHLAMRPWNVTCAYDDAYVLCYPVADESLGIDRTAPSAHLVRLHKALADERRLRILKLLASSDLNLHELSDHLGLAKSTVHHHTVVLRAAGLIRTSTSPENRYSLRRESLAEAGTALRDFVEGVASA